MSDEANDLKIKYDELIDFGLEDGSCVLFLGPELIRFDGEDYNLSFFKSLPEDAGSGVDKQKVKYNEAEKIWSFSSKSIQREFYFEFAKYFKSKRDIDNPVFHKLASLPFPLIISLIPDDTVFAAFSQYENFKFSFRSYLLDNEIPEPTKDEMLIYNIYGNIRNREYVASHFDYLNFILEYAKNDFPKNLVSTLKKANYLVFVGFQFDKWYNILLLYLLNLIKSGTDKYAVEEQSVEELYKKLSDTSLKILFIDQNDEIFINELYQKVKEKNMLRDIMPKQEYLKKLILSNQQLVEKIKERLSVTTDPKEQKKLEMDKEQVEKDNAELMKKLM
jgi:hypothetical protein